MLKVQAIGGYNEVGRNMTLVTCDNESLILDMGIHLDRMLNYTDDEDISKFTAKELVENGIIPDDRLIKNKKSVVGIVPSHGHLDHIAAVPYLARNYQCPIFCTPYTAAVIFRQYKDNKFRIENKIIPVPVNGKIKIGNEFTVEFLNMTHSIPHTAMLFVHTRYGTVVYANDFKLDLHPTLTVKPDMKRIEAISKNVRALVCECLRASITGRTPSESVAVQMLQDILDAGDYKKNCIFITTFSSHIERLHSIVKLAKRYNRKVLFLGRSLEKYSSAAKDVGISNLINEVELVPFRNQVKRRLKILQHEDRSKYIVVMTGHQGEKQAVLANMLNGELPNVFNRGDVFIFSCNVIPTAAIEEARMAVEEKLELKGVRLFKDVHVSGHASKEDLRDLIKATKPEHVIPSHGTLTMMKAYAEIAQAEGYVKDKTLHFLDVGNEVLIPK